MSWATGRTPQPAPPPMPTPTPASVQTPHANILELLAAEQQLLRVVVAALVPSIFDLFALARANRALWAALAGDHKLWRGVYLDTDPLVTPDIRKRMLKESYTRSLATTSCTLPRSGLQQSAWLRSCTLLYSKPRLVLVMGGRDPIIVRRLGQPEDAALRINLGICYSLDSYLDEDMRRFAVEFPQIFQDLDCGDLVVSQDFKGAGLWTAVPGDADSRPFLKLHKNGRDSAGFGILGKDQAPPMFPLLYYCDAELEAAAGMARRDLAKKQLYWFSYTMLADKSMFSWHNLEVLESL